MALRIIKVPAINALGKKGSEKAGNEILNELKKTYGNFEKLELEEIHLDNSNIQESQSLIYDNSKEEFEKKGGAVFLGGDHSISYPIVSAFSEVFEDPFLIILDAHADCMKPMKEPTHEEWLRALVERGFKADNVILLGARKIEKEEMDFINKNKITLFQDLKDMETIIETISKKSAGKDIYLSIDIDVLDPAFAPAVNYPETGGLLAKELFYFLKKIFSLENLKAMDIVEIVPDIDRNFKNRTIKIAAKILNEFLEKDASLKR